MHLHNTRMIKHYESFSLFEDFSLLVQLEYLLFFDNFDSVVFCILFCKENLPVRPLTEHSLEFKVSCAHLLNHLRFLCDLLLSDQVRRAVLMRGGLVRVTLAFFLLDMRELQPLHHLHSFLF